MGGGIGNVEEKGFVGAAVLVQEADRIVRERIGDVKVFPRRIIRFAVFSKSS
jgi:hypothetical protein